MPDYSRGKIYKLICHRSVLVYIGSTCEPTLAKRLASHVVAYKRYLNGKRRYVSSFKVLESGVYEIILIENCPCDNKDELRKRERFFIEERECVNKNLPGRTMTEYNNNHKAAYKQYYIVNKPKFIIHAKSYYTKNKDKVLNYHKQYYADRKTKKLEQVEILLPPVILE